MKGSGGFSQYGCTSGTGWRGQFTRAGQLRRQRGLGLYDGLMIPARRRDFLTCQGLLCFCIVLVGMIVVIRGGRRLRQGIFQGMGFSPGRGGLFHQFLDFRPVHECGLAGILFGDLPLHIRHAVLLKEFSGGFVATQFHGIDLTLRPFVQIHRTDKGRVDPHAPVLRRTIETEENAIRDGRPSGTRGGTIKANLIGRDGFDFLELCILIGRGDADGTLPGGRKGPILA
mmetsp:Transcript_5545/g.11042  ORF Transcript_5545/g.11042 Transcript_5545/m.11042 type:complete len:228 (+) Transcript_5545:397-1080(+)